MLKMEWSGKKMRIIFDDLGKTLSKVGEVLSSDPVFVEIETERGIEVIPVSKIIRMEVIENGS